MEVERLTDFRSARLVWLLAEINRNEEQQSEPYRIEEFLLLDPGKDAAHKKQTPEDMLIMVQYLNASFGGKVIEN